MTSSVNVASTTNQKMHDENGRQMLLANRPPPFTGDRPMTFLASISPEFAQA
jgi:hypothetical protein